MAGDAVGGFLSSQSARKHHQLDEYEKHLLDSKRKKAEGPKIFERLVERLIANLHKAASGKEVNAYRITRFKSGPFSLLGEKGIRVQRGDRKGCALTVTFSSLLHRVYVECGGKKCEYSLTVGDDNDLWLETSTHDRKSVEELGAEILRQIAANC